MRSFRNLPALSPLRELFWGFRWMPFLVWYRHSHLSESILRFQMNAFSCMILKDIEENKKIRTTEIIESKTLFFPPPPETSLKKKNHSFHHEMCSWACDYKVIHICVCSVISESTTPWTTVGQAPWNFPSKNNGADWHFRLQGIFSGIDQPVFLSSSALAGRFFTSWATKEVLPCIL